MGRPADEPPPLDEVRIARAQGHGLRRFPDVMEQLDAGRGFDAHALLVKRLRTTHDADEREIITSALADARLFVEPAGKAPGLGRLNGVGTGMYGNDQYDRADGTYVKTRYFSFIFVPIVPVDRWLVQDAPSGGWYFISRLPASRTMQLWRLAAAAAGAALVVVIAFVAWWTSSHTTVHLLNGLDTYAEVSIDDGPAVRIDPGAHEQRTFSSGPHRFQCTVSDRIVDQREEVLIGGSDLTVYSVAGAAPLWLEDVTYHLESSASRNPASDDDHTELLSGHVFTQRSKVDYAFTDPPQTVKLNDRTKSEKRTHACTEPGGWRRSVEIAEEMEQNDLAAEIAEAAALAQRGDAKVVAEATEISRAYRKPELHKKFLDALSGGTR